MGQQAVWRRSWAVHVRMRATMPEQWANLREISAQQCSAFVRQFSLTNPKRREAKESLQQRKWDRGRGKPQSRGCGTPEVAKAPYTRTTRRWHPPPPAWGPPSQLLRPQQPADFSIFQGSLHSAHVIKTSKDTCTLIEPLYHTLPERVEHLHVASHAFAYCSLIQSNAQRCGSTRLFVHSSPGQQAQVATRAVLIHVLWLQEVHELVKVIHQYAVLQHKRANPQPNIQVLQCCMASCNTSRMELSLNCHCNHPRVQYFRAVRSLVLQDWTRAQSLKDSHVWNCQISLRNQSVQQQHDSGSEQAV